PARPGKPPRYPRGEKNYVPHRHRIGRGHRPRPLTRKDTHMITRRIIRGLVAAGALAWLGGAARGASSPPAPPAPTPTAPPGAQPPEWVQKIYDVLTSNTPRNPAPSPLYRSKSRLGWTWLAKRPGLGPDATIPRRTSRGPAALFDRLDRDG